MKIKKFNAPSLKQAAEKMKAELGPEAIILSTRIINPDETDAPKSFEVIAGIDEDAKKEPGNNSKKPPSLDVKPDSAYLDELRKIAEKTTRQKSKTEKPNISQNTTAKKGSFQIKEELNNLGSKLMENEVSKPLVKNILKQLYEYKDFLNKSNLNKYLLMVISSMIKTESFKLEGEGKPIKVGFVGPTGVGKTTCIAKLATISKILHNLDVGIISVDTYRLGAIDQLRIFSDIVDIDMLVAYEPKDMQQHLKTFKNKDIVFIDTAGRSQKNSDQLQINKNFLDSVNLDYTYLVLSATSSSKTLIDIADKFQIFDYNSFIFSKLDEGVAYGNLLNLVDAFDYPVVYLTNGQTIPDDIISADSEYLSKAIFSGRIN